MIMQSSVQDWNWVERVADKIIQPQRRTGQNGLVEDLIYGLVEYDNNSSRLISIIRWQQEDKWEEEEVASKNHNERISVKIHHEKVLILYLWDYKSRGPC